MGVNVANFGPYSQAAFQLALERRVLRLGEIRGRREQTLSVQCEALTRGLDQLIAWLGFELHQRRQDIGVDGESAALGWWLADEHFLSLLVLHRRSLSRGTNKNYTLCRDLLLSTALAWLEYRRVAHGLSADRRVSVPSQ
jgi:hypothetical protein